MTKRRSLNTTTWLRHPRWIEPINRSRMIMDHPENVERAVVMDIAPTDKMYAQTS
jgi:hypothetical protein